MDLELRRAAELGERPRLALERERARLATLGISGDLALTGGSSLPDAVTAGDVDLHLRVDRRRFADVVTAMRARYRTVNQEIWSTSLATFAAPDDALVGIAVTPIGSVHDRRFRRAWKRLARDRAALERYNRVKRDAVDLPSYLAAKGAFFNDLERRARTSARVDIASAALPAAVALVAMWTALVPQRAGVLALAQIFLPHAVLAMAVLLPVAAARRMRWLGAALLVVAVTGALRFGSEWVSIGSAPASEGGVRAMSWNLEAGGTGPAPAVAAIRASGADIVALQELTPAVARSLEADSGIVAEYPHRELRPAPGVTGMGLLSRYPVSQVMPLAGVSAFRTTVTLQGGGTIEVINAHPFPGRIGMVEGIPVTFDAAPRDAQIARVREAIDPILARGEPLLVLGDFNVVSTEPAYATLTAGLRDAHIEVGNGPGWTWRPSRLEWMRAGVIRIDYVLASPDMAPVQSGVVCEAAGDHCRVTATLRNPER